jgi:hypothetical protein
MTAVYNYWEPFSCECRAFGRLKEAGHEELAVQCFGYVLLDQDHERAILDQFRDIDLCFTGDMDRPGDEETRTRFLGKGGRPPPVRGIIKEFGPSIEDLQGSLVRKIFRDVVKIQQLGIIGLDMGHRQIIGGKLSDLSIAITTPHPLTTPELNPNIEPAWVERLTYATFMYSRRDYWQLDDMVREWNAENGGTKKKISFHASPSDGPPVKYNLRSKPSRQAIYTLVDPRRYDWKASAANPDDGANRPESNSRKRRNSAPRSQRVPKHYVRLKAKPPGWYGKGTHMSIVESVRNHDLLGGSPEWEVKNGLIFPRQYIIGGPRAGE